MVNKAELWAFLGATDGDSRAAEAQNQLLGAQLTNSYRLLHLLQLFHIHDCGSKTFVTDRGCSGEGEVEETGIVAIRGCLSAGFLLRTVEKFLPQLAQAVGIRTGDDVEMFLGIAVSRRDHDDLCERQNGEN